MSTVALLYLNSATVDISLYGQKPHSNDVAGIEQHNLGIHPGCQLGGFRGCVVQCPLRHWNAAFDHKD
jgi:hypothetical protein